MVVTGDRITLRIDTDFTEEVFISDEDGAIDITNDTIKNRVLNSAGTAVLEQTVADGSITVTNGPGGVCEISYAATAIAAITPGGYKRYLLVTHNSECKVVHESELVILPSKGAC